MGGVFVNFVKKKNELESEGWLAKNELNFPKVSIDKIAEGQVAIANFILIRRKAIQSVAIACAIYSANSIF